MLFNKEDLDGFYEWMPESERSVFDGSATRRLFDRWNGNQVLFLINLLLNNSGNFSVGRGKKIEKLIIDHLPLDKRSEVTVFNWLQSEIAKNNEL
jgi:hypothetical protein